MQTLVLLALSIITTPTTRGQLRPHIRTTNDDASYSTQTAPPHSRRSAPLRCAAADETSPNDSLPPAPSRINTLPEPVQAAIVAAIALAIGLGANVLTDAFGLVRGSALFQLSRPTWPALGLIYLAAGVGHFTAIDGFINITPPNKTWGIWWTPFSPRFNVQWTGVAEIFGGAWMLLGALAPVVGVALPPEMGPALSDGALTCWLITVAVTPANIYALTHGVEPLPEMRTSPTVHAVRLAFQSVLLAMFWEMAQPTILDAQSNLGLL